MAFQSLCAHLRGLFGGEELVLRHARKGRRHFRAQCDLALPAVYECIRLVVDDFFRGLAAVELRVVVSVQRKVDVHEVASSLAHAVLDVSVINMTRSQ